MAKGYIGATFDGKEVVYYLATISDGESKEVGKLLENVEDKNSLKLAAVGSILDSAELFGNPYFEIQYTNKEQDQLDEYEEYGDYDKYDSLKRKLDEKYAAELVESEGGKIKLNVDAPWFWFKNLSGEAIVVKEFGYKLPEKQPPVTIETNEIVRFELAEVKRLKESKELREVLSER